MPATKLSPDHPLNLLRARGLGQGYLTFGQIREHLPDTLADSGLLTQMIQILNHQGVYEQAPQAPVQTPSAVAAKELAEAEEAVLKVEALQARARAGQTGACNPLSPAACDAGLESPSTHPGGNRNEPGKPA